MSRFLDALNCKQTDRPPVWLMRQAGRYLPEYREIRKKHKLEEMFLTPEVAAEVTLQPIRRFGFDAAILFADILTPCAGFGLDVTFEGGPKVRGEWQPFEIERIDHVKKTIGLLKQELDVPLIGFSGGPLTVAKYVEGAVDMDALTDGTIEYLKMQIEAGVDAIQIFDSWSGLLPKPQFCEKSLPYLQKIVDALKPFPVIIFTRGSCNLVNELVSLGTQGISFDWDKPISSIRKQVPDSVAVQGNLNPELLKQPRHIIEAELMPLLETMRRKKGFILNLGHGMTPDIPVEGVETLMDIVTNSR